MRPRLAAPVPVRAFTPNGPALWDTLLEALNVPGAVIAGGCIRDYHLGLTPKDYDICVPGFQRPGLIDLAKCREGVADLTPLWWDEDGGEDKDYDSPDLIGVLEGELLGHPVNIIARADHDDGLKALIEGFDFHIVQFAYSTQLGITGTDAAEWDLANRTATLAHTKFTELSYKRFDRFNVRNPGVLTMVDPYQGQFDFV